MDKEIYIVTSTGCGIKQDIDTENIKKDDIINLIQERYCEFGDTLIGVKLKGDFDSLVSDLIEESQKNVYLYKERMDSPTKLSGIEAFIIKYNGISFFIDIDVLGDADEEDWRCDYARTV